MYIQHDINWVFEKLLWQAYFMSLIENFFQNKFRLRNSNPKDDGMWNLLDIVYYLCMIMSNLNNK